MEPTLSLFHSLQAKIFSSSSSLLLSLWFLVKQRQLQCIRTGSETRLPPPHFSTDRRFLMQPSPQTSQHQIQIYTLWLSRPSSHGLPAPPFTGAVSLTSPELVNLFCFFLVWPWLVVGRTLDVCNIRSIFNEGCSQSKLLH